MSGLRVGLDRSATAPGTERIEELVAELIDPGAGLPPRRRHDGAARRARATCSREFERAEGGVLVGTQMVAKGHDFPDVALSVLLDADSTLRYPDFRAEERTFALVAQLAGRSGRGERGGRVLVQTLAPDAVPIAAAAPPRRRRLPRRRARAPARVRLPAVLGSLIAVELTGPDEGALAAAGRPARRRDRVPASARARSCSARRPGFAGAAASAGGS